MPTNAHLHTGLPGPSWLKISSACPAPNTPDSRDNQVWLKLPLLTHANRAKGSLYVAHKLRSMNRQCNKHAHAAAWLSRLRAAPFSQPNTSRSMGQARITGCSTVEQAPKNHVLLSGMRAQLQKIQGGSAVGEVGAIALPCASLTPPLRRARIHFTLRWEQAETCTAGATGSPALE